MSDVTQILGQIQSGDPSAAERLLPLVYDELRRLASQKLAGEAPGQTLQSTALVHEAYLRLTGDTAQEWDSRWHFFMAAAEAMRRILVENARRKQRLKRGGNWQRVPLSEAEGLSEATNEELVALDEALSRLADLAPLKAKLVELRFFAGMGNNEAAKALGISTATAMRYWRFSRAWLHQAMDDREDRAADS